MENSCHYFAYVDSYVHDELHGKELIDFESHLGSCGQCIEEVANIRRVKDGMTESFSFPLDERFNYSVLSDLRKVRAPQPAREIRIALEDIVISLATLLVIVLIGIQLFHKPEVSSVEMVGRLTNIEKSSLDQTTLSDDQVLELVLRNK